MIIYITGGARSGKSRFAEAKVASLGEKVAYIATAIPFDDGMKDRIAKHQSQRPASWQTIEQYKHFETLIDKNAFLEANALIFDCATVMITNIMMDSGLDFDTVAVETVNALEREIAKEVEQLLKICREENKQLVIVSNEVGLGLVPSYRMGNFFRDIQGRINQLLASEADEVHFVVSGIPLQIK
ncbi:bifunctional adenosylcobinamide kinase/adenosylcobinamide-phosphate guanylyltransferase [Fusibacter paucivorans]|uniref:Adenosylcobinamide kinase n=1 Tax=Fusibacter paucivorans TaxID=76009 RepID=A0ABS5PR67_9FIRM|nr:bifunctional adenosylcobinamide kinase/adenosylcobinamide-phosphate guanylyltransferase [Fusibacter paucivorans]MBS7527377.1 bifunctional adenosylcobinamide kinase/adenosylcobinamide-phosphate guanylyltransferase [Fusibacter paucivorans]